MENTELEVKKRGAGRPAVVLTEDQIIQVEKMAGDRFTLAEIADHFDISETTLSKLKAEDSRIFAAYKRGRRLAKGFVVGKLREKINAGSEPSIFFWLKTQEGWREKSDINLSNEDGSLTPPQILVTFATENDDDKAE